MIDDLVTAAARTKENADYERLFDSLSGAEVFFNLSAEKTDSPTGEARSTPVSTPLVDAGRGLRAVLLFTSKDNANLKKPFAGMPWQKALEMIVKMPQADGLVLQNKDAAWVAIDKKRAGVLLKSLAG